MHSTALSPDPSTPFVPERSAAAGTDLETATFAGGCFWGVEDAFRRIPGVVATRVGYAGGRTQNPTYSQVCSHTTGHAEAVEVVYDPARVTYDRLVTTFLIDIHDPTRRHRRGPDTGDQYRSAIFVHDAGQRESVERVRARLGGEGRFHRPITTEVVEAPRFWEAEEYHQQYYEKRGGGTCNIR